MKHYLLVAFVLGTVLIVGMLQVFTGDVKGEDGTNTSFTPTYETNPSTFVVASDAKALSSGDFEIGLLNSETQRYYPNYWVFSAAPSTFAKRHNIRPRIVSLTPEGTDRMATLPLVILDGRQIDDATAKAVKDYLAKNKGVVFALNVKDFETTAKKFGADAPYAMPDEDPLVNGVGGSAEKRGKVIKAAKVGGTVRLVMVSERTSVDRSFSLDTQNANTLSSNVLEHVLKNGGMVRKLEKPPLLLAGAIGEKSLTIKAKGMRFGEEKEAKLTLRIYDLDNRKLVTTRCTLRFDGGDAETTIEFNTGDTKIENTYAYRVEINYEHPEFTLALDKTLADIIGVMNVRVLGQNEVFDNSVSTVRIMALNQRDNSPMPNAKVQIKLYDGETLITECSTTTDDRGTINAPFKIKDVKSDSLKLEIIVASPLGHQKIMQELAVRREFKILMTTDKPLYQPGQIIHIRTLSLQHPAKLPAAGKKMLVEVEDPKGNKMFKREMEVSRFGIASADFQLAGEINMGVYTVRAILDGKESQEKKVEVKRYVLPKFNVKVETDRSFYMPGDTVKGSVQADYFFGKPVAGGEVKVDFVVLEAGEEVMGTYEGKTDKNGHCEFEYKLKDYFVGHPLTKGNAPVFLRVLATDTADQKVEKSHTVTVSKEPIEIYAIPESGNLVYGVENIIYLMATYPDGSPASRATFAIGDEKFRADEIGIASIKALPEENAYSLKVGVKDEKGATTTKDFTFNIDRQNEQVLLRLDRVFTSVGDTLNMTAFSSLGAGTAYFDVMRDGQIVLTTAADLEKGRATVSVDLSADYAGTLVVSAYQVNRSGQIVRDTKSMYVAPANDLHITVKPDKDVYLPGEEATFHFTVTDAQKRPALAALGVVIVDEAVFALTEMQPGLEKIFFTLEREIMTPRYEIHGYSVDNFIVNPVGPNQPIRETAAKVLAASVSTEVSYSLDVTTKDSQYEEFYKLLEKKLKTKTIKIAAAVQAYAKAASRNDLQKIESMHTLLDMLIKQKKLGKKDTLDPWGNAFKFPRTGQYRAIGFYSPGPDGRMYTQDDVFVNETNVFPGDKGFWFRKYDGDVRSLPPAGIMNFPRKDEWGFLPDREFKAGKAGAGGGIDEFHERMEAMPPPMAEGLNGAKDIVTEADGEKPAAAGAKPRLRQFFPETLLFRPEIITDKDGRATLTFPMADSITTWRMSTMAGDAYGALGSMTTPIRVFMDFFIDLDLPVAFTQNDYVEVPVAAYNYLKEKQTITLTLEKGDWYELTGDAKQTLELDPSEVGVTHFAVKVKDVGRHTFTVLAESSSGKKDYIRKGADVEPDGQMHEIAFNGKLKGDVEKVITIPEGSIDGAYKVIVSIYPGVFSQLQDGMDRIFRMPYGCFEQTSSSTHPNILALDYMKRTKKINPELQLKAEQYINLGYQRLVSFEVEKGGGFSVFGSKPANRVLTAYGLMEFHDMSRVYSIDPDIISRTQRWLGKQQLEDGSWVADKSFCHAEMWGEIQKSNILPTAYVAWGLAYSGYKGPEVAKGINYLVKNLDAADNAYTLAIILNALALEGKHDAALKTVIEKLDAMKKSEGDKVWWESGTNTISYSRGGTADIEATALVVSGLLTAETQQSLVSKALNFIIDKKSPDGNWPGTQATILSLRALVMSAEKQTEKVRGDVTITVGSESQTFAITKETSDIFRIFDLQEDTKIGDNKVKLSFKGEGATMYQIVGRYYTPWGNEPTPMEEPMSIAVKYDKTSLTVNDMITANVKVTCSRPVIYDMVMIDLGIPPGFEVQTGDLAALVEKGLITRFETTGRQIILYVEKLDGSQGMEFSYRMKAKFVLKAKSPKSKVYRYYNPEEKGESRPIELEVN
ncbi:MAG: MG2 domain-containing protein [Planctomycetota bacterium]